MCKGANHTMQKNDRLCHGFDCSPTAAALLLLAITNAPLPLPSSSACRYPSCKAGCTHATRRAAHCCRLAAILSLCCGQLCRVSLLLPAEDVRGIGVGADAQPLHQLARHRRCRAGEERGGGTWSFVGLRHRGGPNPLPAVACAEVLARKQQTKIHRQPCYVPSLLQGPTSVPRLHPT